jgi:hypothetical protein
MRTEAVLSILCVPRLERLADESPVGLGRY